MTVRRLAGVLVLAVAGRAGAETLRPGDAVTHAAATGETFRFTVDARQGEYVALEVEQTGADVVSTVTAPDGSVVLQTDSPCGPSGPDPVAFVAPHDGAYAIALRVVATPWGPGRIDVRLDALREPTDTDVLRAETVVVHALAARLVEDDDRRKESLPHLRAALAGWQRLGDRRLEMWSGMMLGNVLDGVFGERQQAADAFVRPLALARELGDEWAEARIGYNNAQPLRRMGRIAEARALFERSIALHRAAGRLRDLSNALRALSDLLRFAGDDETALALTQEALQAAEASGDANMRDRARLNLAQMLVRMWEPEQALAVLDGGFPGFEKDRQGRGAVWGVRAQARKILDHNDGAYEAWLETIDLNETIGNRPAVAETMIRLADFHREWEDWDGALALIEPAIAILAETGDRLTRAGGECRLGGVQLRRGEVERARRAFEASLELAGDGAATARVCATVGLARVAAANGDLESARAQAERAVEMIEAARMAAPDVDRRAGVVARSVEVYELLADLRMRQHAREPEAGHAAAALAVAETARARSLVELLSEGRARTPDALAPQARTLDAEGIRREVLDGGTLLVEYALGERASYLFVLDTNATRSFELPARSVIEAAARPVREAFAAPQGAAAPRAADAARVLAAMLLGPAADVLGGKRLLLVTPGILQYVPIGALPDPRDPGGAPLVARNEVVQAPSASTVAAIRRAPRAAAPGPRAVAVVADPVYERADPRFSGRGARAAPAGTAAPRYRGEALARLPFSRAEAVAIGRSAGPGHARLDLGFDASRAAVMGEALSGYRYVHFATHGVVDAAQPARSGLVLSLFGRDGRPQEGSLRLRDVYDLRLSADLVVLSGCQTALGRDVRGEGLVGLAGGFLYAGARQVVASLWRVDDLATSELMKRFYRALLQEGRPPAAALRTAQLEMAADPRWRDPYFWAGFVVQGDWRSPEPVDRQPAS